MTATSSDRTRIAIIDYGMGNLHSIAKALEHAAPTARIEVTNEPARIEAADRVVFPGVGAIGQCMEELHRRGLDEVIRRLALDRPFLGICLGLQALLDRSEESGGTTGLGLVPGQVRRFPEGLRETDGAVLKIPHMGWNQVHQAPHPLWAGIPDASRFYFVHSYYVQPDDPTRVAGRCHYGLDFAAAVTRGPLFAVQFHPEKSQQAGLRLLANFARWDGDPRPRQS